MGLAKTFLAIGIAIISAAFVIYGVNVIYSYPDYPYAYSSYSNDCYTKYDCYQQVENCQRQYNYNYSAPGYKDCYNTQQSEEYRNCLEMQAKCTEEAEKQSPYYKHARNSFFILTIVGIILIILGSFLTGFEGIGAGLIGGGVIIVIGGLFYSFSYWSKFNDYVKLIVLGIVLAILIYIGYKKVEKKKVVENKVVRKKK